ncbi:MAG: 2-polyprenylphenol 6-hydroxylase [Hyphomicrobiales bacterium]|nr:2-polyprenylphenol 6-hydroxylase [Hyphomicrobiales bacterium]
MGKISAAVSLIHAGYVLAREGVISAIPRDVLPPPARMGHVIAGMIARRRSKNVEQSERLSIALNKLGPSWVKLGQFLATRPDVIGSQIATDLELLQDRMEPFETRFARQTLQNSLGREVDDVFSSFSEPIAAASIAQVHKAVLKDGDEIVAVKVIRPGVRARFIRDLVTFDTAARLQEKFLPASRRLRPVAVTQMLSQSARIEMDLRLEAAALSEMAENIKDDPGFRVPEVNWELTGRDCLVLEWIEGTKFTDIKKLHEAGHDPVQLAETLMQSFLRHTLRDGFFHADMHPGNLFVDNNGMIIAVDLGITGRMGKNQRRFLAEILYGFITRNYLRVAEVHFEAGYVPHHHDVNSFAQAIRAIGEPIHGQSAKTISMANMLTLLFEVTELFDMETRTELLLLQKTMVVVEGVSRTLDPDFNMWKVSEPVVSQWIAGNLGPAGIVNDAAAGLKSIARVASQLPQFAERAERLSLAMDDMAENGMRFSDQTADQIGKSEAWHGRWGRRALWMIALTAIIAVYMQYFA